MRMILILFILFVVSPCEQALATAFSQGPVRNLNLIFRKHYNRQDFFLQDYSILQYDTLYDDQEEYWVYGLSLEFDFTLARSGPYSIYWDQKINGDSTNVQYRRVHWEFEIGVSYSKHINFFHYHRSEHALDVDKAEYPLYDYHGLRFCFIGNGCQK